MNKYNDFLNIVSSGYDFIDILSGDDDEMKPFCIINIKNIENKFEADLLLSHLTGVDGRIREAVSFILPEIMPDKFYDDEKSQKILTNGILDINPNVVRNLICFIEKSEFLKTSLQPFIISKTREIIEELSIYTKGHFFENKQKSLKNHAKNKLTFNLYWLLETISILKITENIEDILSETSNFLDYTIREKTALILSKMDNPPKELLQKLKNDKNLYVKNQLLC